MKWFGPQKFQEINSLIKNKIFDIFFLFEASQLLARYVFFFQSWVKHQIKRWKKAEQFWHEKKNTQPQKKWV